MNFVTSCEWHISDNDILRLLQTAYVESNVFHHTRLYKAKKAFKGDIFGRHSAPTLGMYGI